MKKKIFLLFFILFCKSNSQVVAVGDTTLCENQQGDVGITLTATSFAVDLNDANIYIDDTYGGVINMEFDFEFYGNTYNQVILSSNNYLSFNVANAGAFSNWAINQPVPNNFDAPLNSILCPWQDIYPGVNGNGTIQYATIGQAPNRVFIASFCGIPMFSCTDICYSSQIKLYETSNIIETHIAEKVLCTSWNGGVAIHALHNEDGTVAHVVTGQDGIIRNFPNQWTCENDGWRFTPNGNNDYIIESIEFSPAVAGTDIIWQDQNGNQIGTGGEIVVFPNETTTYTAGASLCGDAGDWCGFEGGIEGDDVTITFENVEISSVDIVNATCDDPNFGSAIVFIDGTGGPYQYSWLNSDGQEISTLAASIGSISAGEYQFTVSTDSGCEDTTTITIDTEGDMVSDAFAGADIETCDFQVNISGSLPVEGESGFWSVISGQGNFENPTNPTTIVSGLSFGENIFAWNLQNECGVSFDEISVYLIDGTPSINMSQSYECLDQINLNAEVENNEGSWTVYPNEDVVIDDVNALSTFAFVQNYGQYTFTFNGCNGQDSQVINMLSSAPVISGPEIVQCLESIELEASVPGDFGSWSFIGPGNVEFSNSDAISTFVSVDEYGLYEFIYSACGTESSISVEFLTPSPSIQNPGVIYCTLESELQVNSDFDGEWSVQSLNEDNTISIFPNGNLSEVSVSDYGQYTVYFTSCGVTDSLDLIFSTVSPNIVTSNNNNCLFSINLNVNSPDLSGGPWECIDAPIGFSPTDVLISNPFSNSTSATVPAYGLYSFSFQSCNVVDTVEIGVSCPISVPNTFSPNGDGINDNFVISDIDPNIHTQSVLYVFNRWGGVVYINPNYGLSGEWWDGQMMFNRRQSSSLFFQKKWDESDDFVKDGTYFYTLEVFNTVFNQKEFYSGEINIFTN